MSKAARTVVFVLAATAVNANVIPFAKRIISGMQSYGVSQACQDSVTSLLSSPASDCLNIPGSVAILSTVEGSSWIPPTNAWISDFCAAPLCTDAALTSTAQTVATACSAEIASLGLTQAMVVQYAVQYYPTVKQATCLRDASAGNSLCAVNTLDSLQTAFGESLTPQSAQSRYEMLIDNDYSLARQLACTPCASAAFALVRPLLPESIIGTVTSFVGQQCGVDFVSPPDGLISVVTGTAAAAAARATATQGSAAYANKVVGWLGSALAFTTVFAFVL